MATATGPNWLGSPQHVIGGLALALVVVIVARVRGVQTPLALTLGIGAASTAEILIELVEYPLLCSGKFHYSACYDTLADMGSTLAGGVIGAVAGAYPARDRR